MIGGIHKGMKINLPSGLVGPKTGKLLAMVANAFLNLQFKAVDGLLYPQFDISENNAVIQIPMSQPGGTGGTTIAAYRLKSSSFMQNNYVTARTWDGTTDGSTDIYIAKPTKLRFSISSETLAGLSVSYSSYSISNQTRDASDGTDTESQQITPLYLGHDVIWAAEVDPNVLGITVSGNPVTLMDVNVDGRAWAAIAS